MNDGQKLFENWIIAIKLLIKINCFQNEKLKRTMKYFKARRRLLNVLVQIIHEKESFNPHIDRNQLMQRLGINDVGELNKMSKLLGNDCLIPVSGGSNDNPRFAIISNECLNLYEQYQERDIQRRNFWIIFVVTVTGLLVGIMGFKCVQAFVSSLFSYLTGSFK
jgi:hypothetical protein